MEAALALSVRELEAAEGLELAAVLVADRSARPARRPLWAAYRNLRLRRRADALRPVDLTGELAGAPRIGARDLDAVRALGLGFVLAAEPDAASGELLDVPEHGVWALDPLDDRACRTAPPGFAEICRGEAATQSALRRLGRQGAGTVLARCFVSTKLSSLPTTVDRVARARAYMPAHLAGGIRRGGPRQEVAPAAGEDPPQPPPSAARVLRFLGRVARAWARAQLESVLLLERWHVGIVRRPIEAFLADGFEPEIEWLPHRPARGFLADPFLTASAPDPTLLMELWDDRAERGTIVSVDLEGGLAGRAPRPALHGATHMSYPFAFEHEGTVFCTPESHERGGVFLYALDEDRGGWTERATLLQGIAAVDPTLVRHDERWWLFCGEVATEYEGKLLIWHAPALEGPWEPHPANPVKSDVRSGRPAGTPFVVDGELYRPAQDCAGGYGRAVVINRVTRLTVTEYAEEPVARFAPPPGSPYPAGVHTLAGAGEITALDGKRRVFAPHLLASRLAWKARRFAEKVRSPS